MTDRVKLASIAILAVILFAIWPVVAHRKALNIDTTTILLCMHSPKLCVAKIVLDGK